MRRINIDSKKVKVVSFANNSSLEKIVTEAGAEFEKLNFPAGDVKNLKNDPAIRAASEADIIYCDSSLGLRYGEMGKLFGPHTKIVACLAPGEEDKITDEDADALADIWITPFSAVRARLRIKNLINEIMEAWNASLRASWLDTLMELVPDMVWIKKIDGSHVKVNQAFCAACGKTRRMIQDRDHAYIWDVEPEEANDCLASEEQVIRAGKIGTFEEILKIGDKSRKLRTHKAPLMDPDGKVFGTIGLGNDITNLLNLDLELRIFVDAMPFPLVMVDTLGAITHVNGRFLEFFGESGEDMLNTNYSSWKEWALEPEKVANSMPDFQAYSVKGSKKGLKVQVTERDLVDVFGDTFGHVCIFRDVTAERDLQEQIWRNANLDSLTGMANRHAFNEYARSLDALPKHMIYIDLDNFKAVNDKYGHKAGDDALKIVANMIREHFPDDFSMRQGGDEFMICVTRDVSRENIESETEALCEGISSMFASMSQFANISISAGISSSGDSLEQMIKEADTAMYKFKNTVRKG